MQNENLISFRGSSLLLLLKVKVLGTQSCPILFCDPMDYNPPDSPVHGIFQQEYWSGLPFSSPGDLPHPGIELRSLTLQADSLPSKQPGKPITYSTSF